MTVRNASTRSASDDSHGSTALLTCDSPVDPKPREHALAEQLYRTTDPASHESVGRHGTCCVNAICVHQKRDDAGKDQDVSCAEDRAEQYWHDPIDSRCCRPCENKETKRDEKGSDEHG